MEVSLVSGAGWPREEAGRHAKVSLAAKGSVSVCSRLRRSSVTFQLSSPSSRTGAARYGIEQPVQVSTDYEGAGVGVSTHDLVGYVAQRRRRGCGPCPSSSPTALVGCCCTPMVVLRCDVGLWDLPTSRLRSLRLSPQDGEGLWPTHAAAVSDSAGSKSTVSSSSRTSIRIAPFSLMSPASSARPTRVSTSRAM